MGGGGVAVVLPQDIAVIRRVGGLEYQQNRVIGAAVQLNLPGRLELHPVDAVEQHVALSTLHRRVVLVVSGGCASRSGLEAVAACRVVVLGRAAGEGVDVVRPFAHAELAQGLVGRSASAST